MKRICYLLMLVFISAMLWGGNLNAQEEGTYIDNASPQDSSYMDGDALNFDDYYDEDKGGAPIALILVGAVVVVGGIVVIILRKKKNK